MVNRGQSYYFAPWIWLPDIKLNEDEITEIKCLLNKRYKHTDKQIELICIAIKRVVRDQVIYDKEAKSPRNYTANEVSLQLKKIKSHLSKVQEIIHNEFGLHTESLIDQHYYLNTKRFLPQQPASIADKGPVEQAVYDLEQAVTDLIDEGSEYASTKNKSKSSSEQYRRLIIDMAKSCLKAEVKFKIKQKQGSPFYRLIEWIIQKKLCDVTRKSHEGQIKSALAFVKELNH